MPALLKASLLLSLLFQAPSPPAAYDVVSIRPNRSGSHDGTSHFTPDGLTITNLPVRFLLVIALHTREGLIFGLPPWTENAAFDISAKVALPDAKPLTEEQHKAMLAAILADRFHLAFHKETRQLPVYNLVVAHGGSKLKPTPPLAPGQLPPPDAGSGFWKDNELTATDVPLSGFVNMLADELNRNVIDQTGLTANYNIHLQWTPDQVLDADNGKTPQEIAAAPPLFTALQEQLGLKLVPARGPVTVYVVDHIDRPVPN